MRYLTTFLISFLVTFSYSQNSNFSIGIEANLGQTELWYMNDGTVPSIVQEVFKREEVPSFGYDLGLMVEYQVSKSIVIQTGITYSELGYEQKKNSLIFEEPDPFQPTSIKVIYDNTYIEIPLRINYYLNSNDGAFFICTGLSPSINLNNFQTTRLTYSDRTEGTRAEDMSVKFSEMNLVAQIGIGWEVAFKNRFRFYLMPNYKSQLFGIAQEVNLNRSIMQYGIAAGLKFN